MATFLISAQSSFWTQSVNGGEGEGIPEEEVYEPVEGASDEETAQEDAPLQVMRCILATPHGNEDWRRTTIFQTYSTHGDKYLKLIIDGGSSLNVVAKSAVATIGLKRLQVLWRNRVVDSTEAEKRRFHSANAACPLSRPPAGFTHSLFPLRSPRKTVSLGEASAVPKEIILELKSAR